MSDDPTTELRRLLIDKHGVPAADVTLEARIVHDLGVDGDDAVELLHDLQTRFGTDFAPLDDCWRDFFNSEGASPREILIGIPVVIICGSLAGLLAAYLHWPKLLAFGMALLLFFGLSWLFAQWFGKELRPLTVAGLVEIVEAGRWPCDPANVRKWAEADRRL